MIFFSILTAASFWFAVRAAAVSNGTADAKLAQIKELLTPLLSENATIIYPDSNEWSDVTHRAAAPRVNPGYLAVVDVVAEDDVVNTVRYEVLEEKKTLSKTLTDQSRQRNWSPFLSCDRHSRLDRRYQ